jgi:crotonobetainyl-CoA:carnitine CoA-transferase CaiB-like acyl-CoA transferase
MPQGDYSDTYLRGVRVLEISDELGEYAGKLLAGLGADVVKVEPPRGEVTRAFGPFLGDSPSPERSLYWWHYNHGKRGITIDLETQDGRDDFIALAAAADIIIDARSGVGLDSLGIGYEAVRRINPALLYARITPFGESGPWASYQGSDLVHLAAGGMMMNTGYDPDPDGCYDTPPIAPQMWHAYHITGEFTVMSILGALLHRDATGEGQYLSASVHHAVSVNTEIDFPAWVARRTTLRRQTGRHAAERLSMRAVARTKDGRWLAPYQTYAKNFPSSWTVDIAQLRKHGMQADLDDPVWEDSDYRTAHADHIADVMDRMIARTTFDFGLWQDMVAAGLTWAPVRRPEENLDDPHWEQRGTFVEFEHPEAPGRRLVDVGARWVCDQASWKVDRRAPQLGEHNAEVRSEWAGPRSGPSAVALRSGKDGTGLTRTSALGRPFALAGVRIVDLGWMLASAGATRFLASMGAEVLKVEWISRIDGMHFTNMLYPRGGREERDAATQSIPTAKQTSVNQSASFHEVNTGKLGISLNLKEQRAKEILEDLIRNADVITEGYSPGTMDRMGFGYDRLKQLNPKIVYVQQSGLGQRGTYGSAKGFGPTAQAFSGLTEMSGLPAPWAPAGIGYSYLDWGGAYNMATAVLAGLYRRDQTGEGCYIDASQVEVGLYTTGTAILDHSANGRTWERYGNRSPYKPAAPSGAYPAAGDDRWIALQAFTEDHWTAIVEVLGGAGWAADPRFASLQDRLQHQDELDRLISDATLTWDRYELMSALQARGVPAAVTQDAQDRFETDPQLDSLGWTCELRQSEWGIWASKTHPVLLSATPLHAGGPKDRHGPSYGEDTDDVLGRVLGFSPAEVAALRAIDVV